METKPPLPPFTIETAKAKVQAAEDAWNTCDPERVASAYTASDTILPGEAIAGANAPLPPTSR